MYYILNNIQSQERLIHKKYKYAQLKLFKMHKKREENEDVKQISGLDTIFENV